MSATFLFRLPDIGCISCIAPIEEALRALPVVSRVTSNVVRKTLRITVQDSLESRQAIGETLQATIRRFRQPATEIVVQGNSVDSRGASVLSHSIKGLVGLFLGFGLMVLAVSIVVLPVWAIGLMASFSTLITLYLGKESYSNAINQFRESKTLTMDTLFSISTLVVIGISIASFFVPYLPMIFETGLLIFGFKHLGTAIEASLTDKVSEGLSFTDRAVKTVLRKASSGEVWEPCLSSDLREGDLIRVRGGETIPVDSLCEQASVKIMTTILSGKTEPELISKGSPIYAGMVADHEIATVELRVLKTTSESLLQCLDEILAEIDAEKAPIETRANELLQYFVPIVIALAMVSGVAIGTLFTPVLGLQCLISVLVTACPCTLGLITPLSLHIGLSKAFSHGVKFTSHEAIEKANEIDTVVFDLNGTLTTGMPIAIDHCLNSDGGVTEEEFCSALVAIEKNAKHPIGAAIARYAASISVANKDHQFIPDANVNHSGISGQINNERYLVGNSKFLSDHGIDYTPIRTKGVESEQIIYVAKSGQVVGYLRLKDPLREDSKFTINELTKMGKAVWICTGADEVTALQYAKELEIPPSQVRANVLGHSEDKAVPTKATFIAELKQQGKKVAMIGDAANDAVALAASDFGTAVFSAASDPMTQQQAGAHIYNASLLPVITAFSLAAQTVESIEQNLLLSLVYNILALSISGGAFTALGLSLNPAAGVALMFTQTALILLNQYRIKQEALPHLSRFEKAQSSRVAPKHSSYGRMYQCGIVPTPGSEKLLEIDALVGYATKKVAATEQDLSTYQPHSPSPQQGNYLLM